MSERRCGICGYIDEICRCFGTGPLPEPQEGAPDYPSSPSAEPVSPGRVSGAPSCDSPERDGALEVGAWFDALYNRWSEGR